MVDFNSATNLNLCWNLVKGNQEWTTLLTSRIKRNNKLISYHIKSSIWTSIKDFYNKVLENTKWIIGNGSITNFWLDTWLDEPLAFKFNIPDKYHKHINVLVSDWLVGQNWSIPDNILAAFPSLAHMLKDIKIPAIGNEDNIIWKGTTNGDLSTKQAYKITHKHNSSVDWAH